MDLLKKILLSCLVSLVILFSFAPYLSPAKADTTWYNQSFQEWYGKVYDPSNPSEIFGERYTAAQVQWIIYGLFSYIIPDKETTYCVVSGNLSTCFSELMKSLGITDASSNPNPLTKHEGLASLVFASDRPLSFISYAKKLGQKYSPVSEVHAQTLGFGFQALSIIQSLWTATRNFAYGVFVIVAIVLAFMVMFRVKISPQVVVSIQSAVPKIVVALILVTFSYAIAGFLVDLMYIVIGLLSLMMSTVHGFFATDPVTIFKFLTTGYIGLNSKLGVSVGIFGILLLYVLVFSLVSAVAIFAAGGGLVGEVSTLGILGGIASIIGIIIFIVMLIMVVFIGIKILWMLVKAFAQILLLTIVAPLQIALGTVVPGLGFGSWLKAFISNLAVFPVTGLFLALSFLFLIIATSFAIPASISFTWWNLLAIFPGGAGLAGAISSNTGWPPLLGNSNAMLAIIFVGVSFMIFTLIPKAADVIKGFMTGRPFAYGTAVGEAVGPIGGLGKAGIASGLGRWEKFREEQARTAPSGSAPYRESWITTLAQNTILKRSR